MTEQGTSFAFRGVVTQITFTPRLRLGWSGQHSLLDFSCKLSGLSQELLTRVQRLRFGETLVNKHQQTTQPNLILGKPL